VACGAALAVAEASGVDEPPPPHPARTASKKDATESEAAKRCMGIVVAPHSVRLLWTVGNQRSSAVPRKQSGTIALNAAAMHASVTIQTADGTAPAHVFRPAGDGPWPAVLVFMDALGIRPAMLELGERLASYGYFVVLPDLYYRYGPYEPMDPKAVFSDPEKRRVLFENFLPTASTANVMRDTQAYLDYIAASSDAKPGKVGTTGYCMGGFLSLTCAGTYPDRVAATASYHGGRLATDAPDSPHLLAPKIQSRVYVAGAIEDDSFPDDMKARLENALTDAHVDHTVETYPAKHGWVFPDIPVYDAAQAEHHWQSLTDLLGATINA